MVGVSWEDAQAFCVWLTKTEHASGRLPAGYSYRLPADHEWSCAVGNLEKEDPKASPEDKHAKTPGVFPWGATNAFCPSSPARQQDQEPLMALQ